MLYRMKKVRNTRRLNGAIVGILDMQPLQAGGDCPTGRKEWQQRTLRPGARASCRDSLAPLASQVHPVSDGATYRMLGSYLWKLPFGAAALRADA